MATASRPERQSRAARLLEVGPALGAAAGLWITAEHGATHRPSAFRCSPHAAESCIGQVTTHTFQAYVVAAGIGAVTGFVLIAAALIVWRVALDATGAASS